MTENAARSDSDLQGHTPGPWRLEDGANSHCFDGRVMAGDDCIAFVALDAPDASLIAAAPDVLAALQWAMAQSGMSYTRRIKGQNETWCDAVDRAHAAIAKARGAS